MRMNKGTAEQRLK